MEKPAETKVQEKKLVNPPEEIKAAPKIDTPVLPEVVAEVKKEPEIKKEEVKVEVPEPVIPTKTELKKDIVIYRIQLISSTKPKGSYPIKIDGKEYMSWEYYYKGAYRTTVGELKTLAEARAFQSKCRQSGFPQAFAVVFVGDERSLDPALFR